MIRATTNKILAVLILLGIQGIGVLDANANPNKIQLGKVSYSGSACPNGSISVSLNPNNARLAINFNQYIVETHGRNQRNLKKTCDISVPLQVPAGVSISLVSANYGGAVALPAGTQARIMNAYSFSGQRGRSFKTDFNGPNNNGYNLRDPLSSLANVWSTCGKNTVLRIKSSTRIKTQGADVKTHADSLQGFVTQFRYRSCQ